jgi:hypothetical protein
VLQHGQHVIVTRMPTALIPRTFVNYTKYHCCGSLCLCSLQVVSNLTCLGVHVGEPDKDSSSAKSSTFRYITLHDFIICYTAIKVALCCTAHCNKSTDA